MLDDELIVDFEEIVYEVVMRWLDYSSENRLGEFYYVFECVRLFMINFYYLYDFVEFFILWYGCEIL